MFKPGKNLGRLEVAVGTRVGLFHPLKILNTAGGGKDGNAPNARSKGEPMPCCKSTAGTTGVCESITLYSAGNSLFHIKKPQVVAVEQHPDPLCLLGLLSTNLS